MIIQHYCYTRTNYIDYGDIVSPTGISEKEIDVVRKKILSITADVYLKLSTPKWLLIKNKNQIVWGCCCWNSLLAVEKSKDYSGTPVYGFFSIVISDYSSTDDIKLPFDIEYFRQLYSLEVEPFWNRREEHRNNTNDYIQGDFKYIHSNQNQYVNIINTDKFQCKSLGNIGREDVVAAALTLDEVSLIIDNDNIEQATNKNGSFMNCLTSSVSFGLHHVKQQCPKCKKYVSSFTQTGVCLDCKETEEVIIRRTRKEDDMDKQMKLELEHAQNRIEELELELEANCSQLKKKEQWIKILAVISVVLFIALMYSQDSFSLKLFERKQEFSNSLDTKTHNESRGRYDDVSSMQYKDASFKFKESSINVAADAHNEFHIKVKSNVSNYEIRSNVGWIKILSTSKNMITISILANNQKGSREGEVTVVYGDYNTNSVVIKQEGKLN